MSFRVVVITKRCKLEYKLGYLICRGEETKKVFISEISSLIIESTAVSITTMLLCELINAKVNIVFCNEKHNPCAQLNALYGRHNASGQLKKQLSWSEIDKNIVWTEIVRRKIVSQYDFLIELKRDKAKLLSGYLEELELCDVTNREGLAAKVYFDELFGLNFKRGDSTFFNGALNYGYSIILSAFNRAIVAYGYNTQLGINHKNEFNHYNLSCDLMEPFRIFVDRFVFCTDEESELNKDIKIKLVNILNMNVKVDGVKLCLTDVIERYVKSVINAIESKNVNLIINYEL